MSRSIFFTLASLLIVLAACNKDPDQTGCTDHLAANYDPSALKDDGSCEFNDDVQMIWSDGAVGGWNDDLLQGSYDRILCSGESEVIQEELDSATMVSTLYLGTGTGFSHRSFFTLINEQDARDFAEGSLRFDARVADLEEGFPEFVRLFISGKIMESSACEPFRRSEYVDISTHSFTDSTFTPVNISIREFDQIMMARVEVVCGFKFEGERNSGIEIDNLRWVANDLD